MKNSDSLIAPGRKRLREFGISIGRFDPGPKNSITDVSGVRVGHVTIKDDSKDGRKVRTGVTAILPNRGNVFMDRIVAGSFVLNGAGEMSGLIQVQEWGILETPILLSNTFSVGVCGSAMIRDLMKKNPEVGRTYDVVIPVVGECDDSWLNDIGGMHVRSEHVYQAISRANSGQVPEGSVGAGTGMVTCDFKAGIGSSSRCLTGVLSDYKIGVLVLSNFGRREELRVDGYPFGAHLHPMFEKYERRTKSYGSIIAVLATDAPLTAHQLNRLSKRVGLGIGRVGSHAAHGSGEIILAFSTANTVPRVGKEAVYRLTALLDAAIDPLYQATIEATEEAILNSMCAAEDMHGVDGHFAPALPMDELDKLAKYLSRRATVL